MWRGAKITGAAGYLLAICALSAETPGAEFLLDSRFWRYHEPEALRLCVHFGDDSGAFGLGAAIDGPDSTIKHNR